tara:strand:+ start:134 stop:280 length:147 start_codon:yes stop_codon:yes gene_type:complete
MILPIVVGVAIIVCGVVYIIFSTVKAKYNKKNKRRNEIIAEIIETRIN